MGTIGIMGIMGIMGIGAPTPPQGPAGVWGGSGAIPEPSGEGGGASRRNWYKID